MRIVLFAHSLVSCWNHGNAHFLRGVARALMVSGHEVRVYEPANGWSAANLRADGHDAGAFERAYPELRSVAYAPSPWRSAPVPLPRGERVGLLSPLEGEGNARCEPSEGEGSLDAALADADAVIVHEWNDPALVAAIGAHRIAGGRYTLLFHDTHHRAVSDPQAIRAFDLAGYDGVLAFGEALSEVYRRWGWGDRVHTWHEAADITLFAPPAEPAPPRAGLVWIGNWGDDERSAELEAFLLRPAKATGLSLDIHGVRYPAHAVETLGHYGARYHGWLANAAAPGVFARHLATVHVPRRHYVEQLAGIPTIRVFEALACGIPLMSAPWSDSEGLFRGGRDFLMLQTEAAMAAAMRDVANDVALRASLAASGLETIRARHTCAHRAAELVAILNTHRRPGLVPGPSSLEMPGGTKSSWAPAQGRGDVVVLERAA